MRFCKSFEISDINILTWKRSPVMMQNERTTKKEAPRTPAPPCVDESTSDALSCGNHIVSQSRVECNTKFVGGKEKTGAAPFKSIRKEPEKWL